MKKETKKYGNGAYKNNRDVLDTLLDPPIAFNPAFKRMTGSTVAAVFLSQSWFWTKIHSEKDDGWWYNSQIEIEGQTGLTRSEQETARRILRTLGLQEEKLKGVPATMHYRVNKTKAYEILGFQFAETLQTEIAETPQTSESETGKIAGKPQSDILADFNKESETTALIISEYDDTSKEYFMKILQGGAMSIWGNDFTGWRSVAKVFEREDVVMCMEENIFVVSGLGMKAGIYNDRYKKSYDNFFVGVFTDRSVVIDFRE